MTAISKVVQEYYESKLLKFGPTSRGVDWKDEESHKLRHAVITDLVSLKAHESVLDFGCGFGHYLTFLRDEGFDGEYFGLDISEKMVEKASLLFRADDQATFSASSLLESQADVVVASGVFNLRLEVAEKDWLAYVDETIVELAASATSRLALNFLSGHSDVSKRGDNLHYESIGRIADLLNRCYSRHLTVRQDYGLYEFSICAFKTLERGK
jgi:SAM-dependent methyltransferase